MTKCLIRKLQQPDDFAAVAPLLNLIWSEPTTADQLNEDEYKIPPGRAAFTMEEERQLNRDGIDPNGCGERDEHGKVVAYAIAGVPHETGGQDD